MLLRIICAALLLAGPVSAVDSTGWQGSDVYDGLISFDVHATPYALRMTFTADLGSAASMTIDSVIFDTVWMSAQTSGVRVLILAEADSSIVDSLTDTALWPADYVQLSLTNAHENGTITDGVDYYIIAIAETHTGSSCKVKYEEGGTATGYTFHYMNNSVAFNATAATLMGTTWGLWDPNDAWGFMIYGTEPSTSMGQVIVVP